MKVYAQVSPKVIYYAYLNVLSTEKFYTNNTCFSRKFMDKIN